LNCILGAGKVGLDNCQGTFFAKAGAGVVTVQASYLSKVTLETGSGAMNFEKSKIDELLISSGSGKFSCDACIVKKSIKVDSASGAIKMKGDFSTVTLLSLRTASGSISFSSTPFPSLDFQVSTASGHIECNVPDLKTSPQGIAEIRSASGTIKLSTLKEKKRRQEKK
jgi:DUF4097 and DUF4098 domain-containing protein YvlB